MPKEIEVTGGNPPNADPSKATEVPVDPFAGINLDELPDDVRANLVNAKTQYTKVQNDAKIAEDRRVQAEAFARTQQSRADKATSVLQRHNLSEDGAAPQQQTPDDPFVKQFIADGMPEAQAKAYAKMFSTAAQIQRNALIAELGPLASTVGNIQADQVLNAASLEHAKVFAIPEVAKEVRDNAAVLVNKNQIVDKQTIDTLVRMAYGNHMMKNPQTSNQPNQPIQVPNFGGPTMGNGGGYVPPAQNPNNQGPTATQPETLTAMTAINKYLREGTKSATKK